MAKYVYNHTMRRTKYRENIERASATGYFRATVYLALDEKDHLRKLAFQMGLSESALLAKALTEFLKTNLKEANGQ